MAAVAADQNFSMAEAEREAEAERRREKVLEEARELERRAQEERVPSVAQQMARKALWHRRRARIVDFDPKQGGVYHNRLYFVDHAKFNLDEESPLGPSRYTNRFSRPGERQFDPCAAVNVFSVKIGSSDVGFPLHVYGTIVARDSLDNKCVYLFRLDRDNCQLLNSEDESLILTGPKRGLALIDDVHVETDLKIRDHGVHGRQLSKGILDIGGMARRRLDKCEVESRSLATRLSTVDVMYAVVKLAVEAAIAIEVTRGGFVGEITAYTTSIQNRFVLYDSKVAGAMTCDQNGAVQLMRSVVSVYLEDMLIIAARTSDGNSECKIKFTPTVNGGDSGELIVGATIMHVKVIWSIMDF